MLCAMILKVTIKVGRKVKLKIKNLASGFSLLEVLISLAIVGGLLMTIISTINYHIFVALRHKEITQTILLAQEKMLQIKECPVNQKGNFKHPFEGYLYEATVSSSPYTGLNLVCVSVRKDKEVFFVRKYVPK